MELNETILYIMPNSWIRQVYVQGVDFESVAFQEATDMFEQIEVSEYIYECLV